MLLQNLMKNSAQKIGKNMYQASRVVKMAQNAKPLNNLPFKNLEYIQTQYSVYPLVQPGQNNMMLMQQVRQPYSTKQRYTQDEDSEVQANGSKNYQESSNGDVVYQDETACVAMDLSVYEKLKQYSIEEKFAKQDQQIQSLLDNQEKCKYWNDHDNDKFELVNNSVEILNKLEDGIIDLQRQQKRHRSIEISRLFSNELNFTIYDKISKTTQKFEIYLQISNNTVVRVDSPISGPQCFAWNQAKQEWISVIKMQPEFEAIDKFIGQELNRVADGFFRLA